MPRSRFSTLIKKYSVQPEPLAFPSSFGPKQLNTTIKKLLKENDVDTLDINFNFFINGELLTESLHEFIEKQNISEEIEEISYDIEMQPPTQTGETKTQDVITKMSLQSKWLVAASFDVQIFNVTNLDKPVIFIEMQYDMFTVEWLSIDDVTETGIIIVGGQYGKISIWSCNMKEGTATEMCKFEGIKQEISCFSVSNELSLVATGTKDGVLSVWSTKNLCDFKGDNKNIIILLPLFTECVHSRCITQLQWLLTPIEPSSENKHAHALNNQGNLLSCSTDFFLKLWNVNESGCAIVLEENTVNPIKCIHSNDNNIVVVGSDNNRLKVYDLKDKTVQKHNIFKAHDNSIVSVKWSPINPCTFITAGIKGAMKMWDIRNLASPLLLISKFQSPITCMDWCGELLASAYGDGTLRVHRFN